MLDDLARFNRERWEDLVAANVQYSRPALDLDERAARRLVDREGVLGEEALAGRRVLCLAAGGGQQSVAFALLGAEVVVLDLTPGQLARDRQAAAHYGVPVEAVEGDMRDLSCFPDARFDLVWQAHSINFVPDARPVLREVGRVLAPGGRYRLEVTNPFVHGTWERDWREDGYVIRHAYRDGEVDGDRTWHVEDGAGNVRAVEGPREFRHTLGVLVAGLLDAGLTLTSLHEDTHGDLAAPPGSWAHFKAALAPWITLWARRS